MRSSHSSVRLAGAPLSASSVRAAFGIAPLPAWLWLRILVCEPKSRRHGQRTPCDADQATVCRSMLHYAHTTRVQEGVYAVGFVGVGQGYQMLPARKKQKVSSLASRYLPSWPCSMDKNPLLFPAQTLRAQLALKRLPPSDFLGAWHVTLQGRCNDFALALASSWTIIHPSFYILL